MKEEFEKSLARAMIIVGACVIPPGLALAAILGGVRGFVGGLVGFAVAALHSVAMMAILKWALRNPIRMLPSILMASYFGRLIVLAGVLYGLHFVSALNMIALLSCFLALYISHTAVEMYYVSKSLGFASKSGDGDAD